MIRTCCSLVAGAIALQIAGAQPQVFRSGVDGVIVPVSVRSGNKPIAGLKVDDFVLTDNGIRQDVRDVFAEKMPIDLTVLLDLSSSVDGPMLKRLKDAVGDAAGALKSDDRIRLVAVSQVLREIFALGPKTAAMPLDTLSAGGATSLYDGLAATMMRATDPGRRQLIVAFTDGRDSTSIIDESTVKEIGRLTDAVVDIVVPIAASGAEARRLTQRAGNLGSLIDGSNVTVNGQSAGASGTEGIPKVLSELVAPTSGQVLPLEAGASISRVFKTTIEEFRATYVLQYVPRGVAAGGWHDIEVSVKGRAKYDIRARKGYRGRGTIPRTEDPR